MAGRGFVFEEGDYTVGQFGSWWEHTTCPVDDETAEYEVDEQDIALVRVDDLTGRRWLLVTCLECAQQVLVYDDFYDPTGEALAAEAAEADAWAAAEGG